MRNTSRSRANCVALLALVALLAIVGMHRGDSKTWSGRQLRQRHLDLPSHASLRHSILDRFASSIGNLAWDWRALQQPMGSTWTEFVAPSSLHGNASICLRASPDLLADAVRKRGYWPECADLPAMLRASGGGDGHGDRSSTWDSNQNVSLPPLFVDVGANVGACSLHVLMATGADVLAFEPGGDNLAYATSTFVRMASMPAGPSVHSRLLLVRAGLGASVQDLELHQAVGNAGHAMIGVKVGKYAPLGHLPSQRVVIRRLDELLWPATARENGAPAPVISLLKLDVEGYECQALDGMIELLRAGSIRAMKLEVFDALLQVQGCSAIALQRRVAAAGFTLRRTESDAIATPSSPPLSPELVHATTPGDPYNLWCVLRVAPAQSPSQAQWASPTSPNPPPIEDGGRGDVGTAVGGSAGWQSADASWRMRRGELRARFLSRKQRTARRLTEQKKHQQQRIPATGEHASHTGS